MKQRPLVLLSLCTVFSLQCKAPQGGSGACVASAGGQRTQTLDVRGKYPGGFIVVKLMQENKDFEATMGGKFEHGFTPVQRSASFRVSKENGQYRIRVATSQPDPLMIGRTADVHLLIFHNGGYLKVPVKNDRVERFHRLLSAGTHKDLDREADRLDVEAYTRMAQYFMQRGITLDALQPEAEDGYCSESSETKRCQPLGGLALYDFQVDFTQLEDAKNVDAQRKKLKDALDQQIELSQPKADEDLEEWQAILAKLTEIEERAGLIRIYRDITVCKEKEDPPAYCKKMDTMLALFEKHVRFPVGDCESMAPKKYLESLRSGKPIAFAICGSKKQGTVQLKDELPEDDYELLSGVLDEELQLVKEHALSIYKKILAKKPLLHIQSNYAFDFAEKESDFKAQTHALLFNYAFPVSKRFTYKVLYGIEKGKETATTAALDLLENYEFHGFGQKNDGIYYSKSDVPYSQFNLNDQIGSLYTIQGYAFALMSVFGPEDIGGVLAPPPPLEEIAPTGGGGSNGEQIVQNDPKPANNGQAGDPQGVGSQPVVDRTPQEEPDVAAQNPRQTEQDRDPTPNVSDRGKDDPSPSDDPKNTASQGDTIASHDGRRSDTIVVGAESPDSQALRDGASEPYHCN